MGTGVGMAGQALGADKEPAPGWLSAHHHHFADQGPEQFDAIDLVPAVGGGGSSHRSDSLRREYADWHSRGWEREQVVAADVGRTHPGDHDRSRRLVHPPHVSWWDYDWSGYGPHVGKPHLRHAEAKLESDLTERRAVRPPPQPVRERVALNARHGQTLTGGHQAPQERSTWLPDWGVEAAFGAQLVVGDWLDRAEDALEGVAAYTARIVDDTSAAAEATGEFVVWGWGAAEDGVQAAWAELTGPGAWVDKADRFFAGFADTVTFGGTTYLRAKFYGDVATRNHSGALFAVGQVTGVALTVAAGFGAGAALPACAGRGAVLAQRATQAYTVLGDAVGVAQSGYAYATTGEVGVGDLLALAPAVGWLGAAANRSGAGRLMARHLDGTPSVCFARDTQVATADGGGVPIGEVLPGTEVLSFDFATGQWLPSLVLERHDSVYRGPVSTIETAPLGEGPPGEPATVQTTAYHPFWVLQGTDLAERPACRKLLPGEDEGRSLQGRWVNSHDLRAGDVVLGADGSPCRVVGTAGRWEEALPVSNLTVADRPNYAVGGHRVLVHNTAGCNLTVAERFGVPDTGPDAFRQWFDSQSVDDIASLYRDRNARDLIESRLRHGGGDHEWLMVSRAAQVKAWGASYDDIVGLVTPTRSTLFRDPVTGNIRRHGTNSISSRAHQQLGDLIDSSNDFEQYRRKLNNWAEYSGWLPNGRADLPDGLRL